MNMPLPPESLPPEYLPPDNDALLSSDDAFVASCLKMLRGELDESACKALAKLLDADADKRRLYVQLAMQTQMIGEVLALHPECDASDANDESHDPYAADIMAEVADSIRMQRHADQVAKEAAELVAQEKAKSGRQHQEKLALMRHVDDRPVSRVSVIPKLVAALSMAAAIGLVAWVGYAYFNPPSTSQTASDDLDPPTHIDQPLAPRVYVARVSDSYDAQWEDFDPADGRLEAHTILLLESGYAEVEFADRGTVLIEGPATIEVVDAGTLRLVEGQLVANTVASTGSLTLLIGNTALIGRGAEFGVSRPRGGDISTVVYAGTLDIAHAVHVGRAPIAVVGPGHIASLHGGRVDVGAMSPAAPNDMAAFNRSLAGIRLSPEEMTPSVQFLSTAPDSMYIGELEDSKRVRLFCESVSISINSRDAFRIPVEGIAFGAVSPGEMVDSYLLHMDPVGGDDDSPVFIDGTITFDRPVVAVLTSAEVLRATDRLYGSPGTRYPRNSRQSSGPVDILTWGVELSSDNDVVTLSPDRRTLTFHLVVSSSLDQLRILVEAAP